MKSIEKLLMPGLALCLVAICFVVCSSCSSKGENDQSERPQLSTKDSGGGIEEREDVKTTGPKASLPQKNLTRESEKKPFPATVPHFDSDTARYEEDKSKVDAVIAEFNASGTSKKKKAFIASLKPSSSGQDPYIIDFVRYALGDSDPEVGLAAIELLEDYRTPEILPVIAQILETGEKDFRVEAVTLLANVNIPQVVDLINIALNDKSEDVREAAVEVVGELDGHTMLDVMAEGISSPYSDVKYEILSMLEDRGDPTSIDLIIKGLRDHDTAFCEEVNETLEFLIDHKFETYEEASFWWKENRYRYDEELFAIEEDE